MRRIKLTVSYDGTNYSGWQIQPNAPTIEAQLDKAIKNLTGEELHVIGASRTDAGVHGLGNVAVFDTESTIPPERFSYALNQYLPDDIQIQESIEVEKDFHPRHCNTRKTYEYKIVNTQFQMPTKRLYSWHVSTELDINAMRKAATYLIGEHDFKSFASVHTQAESTVRTIYSIEIITSNSDRNEMKSENNKKHFGDITIRVKGNGFLYNMVRIIAGTLIGVGKGRFDPEYIKEMLEAKDRTKAGETAPPQGLTLVQIEYI